MAPTEALGVKIWSCVHAWYYSNEHCEDILENLRELERAWENILKRAIKRTSKRDLETKKGRAKESQEKKNNKIENPIYREQKSNSKSKECQQKKEKNQRGKEDVRAKRLTGDFKSRST